MTLDLSNVLITGGAGFIGSHLAEALVRQGCNVRILDSLVSGHMKNLEGFQDKITFFQGDIRDTALLEKAIQGCDTVFHEAAVVSVPQTVADPVTSAQVNELGALQVLDTARRNGVRRLVTASSSAVYGDHPEMPKREDTELGFLSPYALQKRSNEMYARLYHELYGLETVCLRYFNVYGPRQDPSSPYSGVISIFMTRAMEGKPPIIFGDGEQSRDFVFVKDVVRANLLAATVPEAAGQIFNVGTGSAITINRLWEMVCNLSDRRISPEYNPPRTGDIRESLSSIERAGKILGFQPEYTFAQGLGMTWDWYCKDMASKK